MAADVSARLAWAAQVAAPRPGERVLEVGCGHGVLLSQLAARLTSGSVLGLDRSATMTAAAAARNAAAVAAGRVVLQTAALIDADLPDAAFDLVVAVHVGAFWRPPADEYAVVRRVVAEGGRFLLVDQPLQPGTAQGRADRVGRLAAPHGLTVAAVHTGDTPPRPSIAVELRPRRTLVTGE
ncbi:class I SAM-dependent methyltransferase [Modestobacter roseus]|uniref:Methyltransferase family protein n=1 Tax=Modestobacter roseus TaxID=1181884 RepID=A0A562IMG0_9ACTN|nr:class I SAM-dependent methyltransferase [Modestobacter roseus]MQA34280.1 methyltransferase domain-containing protein [Modestobacter roseus]TWH71883.1 methyltransferase family protein [Modestobacter roseus]